MTKTLKNGIMMPIDSLKESNFYAGFNYISFINFSLMHQVTNLRKFVLFLKKGEIPPESHRILVKITPSDLAI